MGRNRRQGRWPPTSELLRDFRWPAIPSPCVWFSVKLRRKALVIHVSTVRGRRVVSTSRRVVSCRRGRGVFQGAVRWRPPLVVRVGARAGRGGTRSKLGLPWCRRLIDWCEAPWRLWLVPVSVKMKKYRESNKKEDNKLKKNISLQWEAVKYDIIKRSYFPSLSR